MFKREMYLMFSALIMFRIEDVAVRGANGTVHGLFVCERER